MYSEYGGFMYHNTHSNMSYIRKAVFGIIVLANGSQTVLAVGEVENSCVSATYSDATGTLMIPAVDVAQPDGSFKIYTANLQKFTETDGFAVRETDLVQTGTATVHDQCHGVFSDEKL